MNPPGTEFNILSDLTRFFIEEDYFTTDMKYTFSVTARNHLYHGAASATQSITYKFGGDHITGLRVMETQDHRVKLHWDPAKDSALVDSYKIRFGSSNKVELYKDVDVDKSVTEHIIGDLAPAETFHFSVHAMHNGQAGPAAIILAKTTGKPLPIPEISRVQLSEERTSVELTWKLPYGKVEDYKFGIFYGINEDDMYKPGKDRVVVQGQNTFIMKKLVSLWIL